MEHYLVIDRGTVVFESRDRQAAEVFLARRRRGVLSQVLNVCVAEFTQHQPQKAKTKRKTRHS